MSEENNWNITVQDVVKVNIAEGDTLLITLPEQSAELPTAQLSDMFRSVAHSFENVFSDKAIKIMVVPYGMEVQIIKSSEFEDK